jgi:hypothetical protein
MIRVDILEIPATHPVQEDSLQKNKTPLHEVGVQENFGDNQGDGRERCRVATPLRVTGFAAAAAGLVMMSGQ